MNDGQMRTFTQIITAFNTTYACFLVDHRLADNPISRAAFYAACEQMVIRDPIPDETLQEELERYLAIATIKAQEEFSDRLEQTFLNASVKSVKL